MTLVMHFYGGTYHIKSSPPSKNEFDYVVHILAPLKMVGINCENRMITSVNSNFAKQNIITGSRIVQINDTYINEDSNIPDLLHSAKMYTPSFIIFRNTKDYSTKGMHIQYDIEMTNSAKNRFPYFKLTKSMLRGIYNHVFDGNAHTLHVYCNKMNGSVTIVLFIASSMDFDEHKLKIKDKEIDYIFKTIILYDSFNIVRKQKTYGIKANGLLAGFGNTSYSCFMKDKVKLGELIYLVKGMDNNKPAFYYVLVNPKKIHAFLEALNNPSTGGVISLHDFGYIIYSGYGNSDEGNEKQSMDDYTFGQIKDVDTLKQYDSTIQEQLIQMKLGTQQQIKNAMDMAKNSMDINEVCDVLETLSRSKNYVGKKIEQKTLITSKKITTIEQSFNKNTVQNKNKNMTMSLKEGDVVLVDDCIIGIIRYIGFVKNLSAHKHDEYLGIEIKYQSNKKRIGIVTDGKWNGHSYFHTTKDKGRFFKKSMVNKKFTSEELFDEIFNPASLLPKTTKNEQESKSQTDDKQKQIQVDEHVVEPNANETLETKTIDVIVNAIVSTNKLLFFAKLLQKRLQYPSMMIEYPLHG
eukprot:285335_1